MADQDGSDVSPSDTQVSNTQNTTEERRASSRPDSSSSGHTQSNTPTLTLSPTPAPSNNATVKPEPLVLKIDERQRLARERREEREKQNAAKELAIQEREERARQHYEKHLEDRRRRLEEQRMKEDKRRVAVEEKRRQKLEEEMARHEAVLRRTVERSQRVKHVPNRWSWGGALPGNSPNSPRDAERRSVSTMNLSKHPADAVITKRLSYSSATLLPSPDRALQKRTSSSLFLSKSQSMLHPSGKKATQDKHAGMRRMQLTPWQSTVGSRLLQPTHSYLARRVQSACPECSQLVWRCR
ncbi:hypothetical protein UPYG_G00248040 [Umbra pygmaea]|uniref:MAP7 n=1 Tax=Umbra pygmaea TaxID=75934 RepID=A0ABD0WNK5_UMBPY